MVKRLDLTGQRFGRLVGVSYEKTEAQAAVWRFRCDCGAEPLIQAKRVRFGMTQSCGCLNREGSAQRCAERTRHGMTDTPTWRSWSHMLDRCNNPNHLKYHRYGGRGIKVCARWATFELFLADMGERPAGKTLDRFPNPDGDYEPGNCRWADSLEQRQNRGSGCLPSRAPAHLSASYRENPNG